MSTSGAEEPNVHADDTELAAAEWMARHNGGPMNATEAAQFQTWLSANPRHARAFAGITDVWTALNEPRRNGHGALLDLELTRRSRQRRRRWRATGMIGLAAALAFMVAPGFERASSPRTEASMVNRPDARVLPDGSTIELNHGSEYAIDFTADLRVVRLVRGEALFEVKSDPTRPFVVRAGAVEVRAIGTAFSVRHDPQKVNVLVTHGQVTVERVAAADEQRPTVGQPLPPPVFLEMGRQVVVSLDASALAPLQAQPVTPDELKAALAWRVKRIEFTDTPLAEAVKLFNGQNAIELVLDDAALGRRLVTGIFWADDPEGFVRLLEAGFGARATRTGDVILLRQE
jgi:transmembrane sensor